MKTYVVGRYIQVNKHFNEPLTC